MGVPHWGVPHWAVPHSGLEGSPSATWPPHLMAICYAQDGLAYHRVRAPWVFGRTSRNTPGAPAPISRPSSLAGRLSQKQSRHRPPKRRRQYDGLQGVDRADQGTALGDGAVGCIRTLGPV